MMGATLRSLEGYANKCRSKGVRLKQSSAFAQSKYGLALFRHVSAHCVFGSAA